MILLVKQRALELNNGLNIERAGAYLKTIFSVHVKETFLIQWNHHTLH
jgi:hypothetical protein